MCERSELPTPLLNKLVKASAELGITEQHFVVTAVAEKLARHEHAVWLEALRAKEDAQSSSSPSPSRSEQAH